MDFFGAFDSSTWLYRPHLCPSSFKTNTQWELLCRSITNLVVTVKTSSQTDFPVLVVISSSSFWVMELSTECQCLEGMMTQGQGFRTSGIRNGFPQQENIHHTKKPETCTWQKTLIEKLSLARINF